MNNIELASHLDVTLVRTNHSMSEIEELVAASKKYKFACTFTLPCYTEYVKSCLKGTGVHTGGVIGFPSGGELTQTKIYEAQVNMALQVDEVDMVINVGWLLSKEYDLVRNEIRKIKDIVCDIPLKCIIEISLLPEDLAKRAAELVVQGGGDYIKTGTGWIAPTTIEYIHLIKSVVGNDAKIKAAGGIRDRKTAEQFLNAGAHRLGVGLQNAIAIMNESEK